MKKGAFRTPKNYDGILPTSRQIKDLLPSVLSRISDKVDEGSQQVLLAWPEIVGKRIASMTQAIQCDSGVLRVCVKNSTLYSLLVEHEKKRLLGVLQKRFPKQKIRDILFRIG